MPKPYHIFISYASEDEQYAHRLAESLQHFGLRIWFAPAVLKVGDRLLDSINAGLIASEYGLALISKSYMAKSWTQYELDVLHRQHIERDKKLLPIWHGVAQSEVDTWNPGLSAIIALDSTDSIPSLATKIADTVYQNAPTRGVTPSFENPQWRFLQGRGDLRVNEADGPCFDIFEAAELPEEHYPLYIYDQLHTRLQIVLKVAKALHYSSHDKSRVSDTQRKRLVKLCQEHGYDLDSPGFDPAVYG